MRVIPQVSLLVVLCLVACAQPSSTISSAPTIPSCYIDGDQLVCGSQRQTIPTNVVPQRVCQNAPSYPSTFIESILCINQVAYGVYSANDGFLAELPPGTYTSNGINSTCTFQILAGCIVVSQ